MARVLGNEGALRAGGGEAGVATVALTALNRNEAISRAWKWLLLWSIWK